MLVAHEAGDGRGLLDDAVRSLVEVHADDGVARDAHVAHALLRVAAVLHDILIRDLDREDVVFHVLRGDALLEVRLHLALVAGVGVDDVPVAGGHVELAAQLGDGLLFRRGRGGLVLSAIPGGGVSSGGLVLSVIPGGGVSSGGLVLSGLLGGDLLDDFLNDLQSLAVGQRLGGFLLNGLVGSLEGLGLGVVFVGHDYSSCEWGHTVKETRLQCPAGGFAGVSRRSMHLAYRIRSPRDQRKA